MAPPSHGQVELVHSPTLTPPTLPGRAETFLPGHASYLQPPPGAHPYWLCIRA